MQGRKKFDLEYAMTQPMYQNIIWLIYDATGRKKKITSRHLNLLLVKNAEKKYTTTEKKYIYKNIFKWEKPEVHLTSNGRRKINSLPEFLIFVTETLSEDNQISASNLCNFLDRLKTYGAIVEKPNGKKKPYYKVTYLALFYLEKQVIKKFIDYFFYHVYYEDDLKKSFKDLKAFDSDLKKSIGKIISSQ